MTRDLVVGALREEEEIAALQAEVARLSELLAEREMEQAELRAELARFQRRYYGIMGPRYVELDDLTARIAEKRAARAPRDDGLAGRARRRRDQAERSAREYRAWAEDPSPPAEAAPPSEGAKRLFRRIAAVIHPDRAEDEASRQIRTALMAELNAAYGRGDIPGMEAILKMWETSPEAVSGDGPGARLERLERTAARIREKISRTEAETARLAVSPLHRLMLRVREAEAGGRDLLAELAADLDRRIVQAREELYEL